MKIPSARMPAVYLPLHKYLEGRYAETVVLRMTEMEDLMGAGLPAEAHLDAAWWDNGADDDSITPQAQCWKQAGRTATPNLAAHNVMFERVR